MNFKCEDCDRTFQFKYLLITHSKDHENENVKPTVKEGNYFNAMTYFQFDDYLF